jgi:hypothetical protein
LGCKSATLSLMMAHKFSMGFMSGDCDGQESNLIFFL